MSESCQLFLSYIRYKLFVGRFFPDGSALSYREWMNFRHRF